MSLRDKTFKLCNCNKSLPIDPERLAAALRLHAPAPVHHALCRQESQSFAAALHGDADVVVGCTQEAPLFREVAQQAEHSGSLRFINIREHAGWSEQGRQAQPKIAALLALASVPEPEPVAAIGYKSRGALLIIGPLEAAVAWAEQLKGQLDVSVLASSARAGTLPNPREYPLWSGSAIAVSGFLGQFSVTWEQANPIDLELCTRCNACVHICPELAIDFSYQIDLEKCRDHRACVDACGDIGAIDFERTRRARSESFDLVLDLSAEPLIRLPHPPQGYLAPGRDPLAQAKAALELTHLVGEFEKPKYFDYKANICAHGRNGVVGCTACIDTCSTGAIRSAGDTIEVEPHLCMGCGGCATVCPSGAIRFAYPRVPDMGARIKTLLTTYAAAGGADACVLFHDERAAPLLMEIGRRAALGGRGLPARVIPLAVHRTSSLGLDLLLGAIAYGASQCVILTHRDEPEGYASATAKQLEIGETILAGLGYAGRHLHLMEAAEGRAAQQAAEAALWSLEPAGAVRQAASFNPTVEKRTTLEFVFDHLARQAPTPRQEITLPSGAPWGQVALDRDKCTLCMACVGACPESALMDAADYPRLKFVERNCVQCGLCVKTCPENALALTPRLLLADEARRERVLNEAEPFNCVRCGKPFATRQMVDSMSLKLASHSMFQGEGALARVRMCADCRIVDMMENKSEITIRDL